MTITTIDELYNHISQTSSLYNHKMRSVVPKLAILLAAGEHQYTPARCDKIIRPWVLCGLRSYIQEYCGTKTTIHTLCTSADIDALVKLFEDSEHDSLIQGEYLP